MKVQRKVTAATAGAAIGEIVTWLLVTPFGLEGVPGAAFSILGAFLLGYFVPNE